MVRSKCVKRIYERRFAAREDIRVKWMGAHSTGVSKVCKEN